MGAPLALAAERIGQPWLFYLGLVLLIVALAVPARSGQRPRERLYGLVRHLPGSSWLRRRGRLGNSAIQDQEDQ